MAFFPWNYFGPKGTDYRLNYWIVAKSSRLRRKLPSLPAPVEVERHAQRHQTKPHQ